MIAKIKSLIAKEPPQQRDMKLLKPNFKIRVDAIFKDMELEGWHPMAVETLRTRIRQKYLYTIGRRGIKGEKPVTWTLESKHLDGNAIDVCDKKYGYTKSAFFEALGRIAKKHGTTTITKEKCHIQSLF